MTTYVLRPPTIFYSGFYEILMLTDANGDGYPDLIARYGAGADASGIAVVFNDGRGDFYPSGNNLTFPAGIVLVTSDLNGDGYPDYVVANYNNATNTSPLEVLLSNGTGYISGDGGSAAPVSYPDPGIATALALANLNADGIPDLVVTNSSGGISVLLGTGSGGFSAAASYDTGTTFTSVTVTDLTGSGISDYVGLVDTGGLADTGVDVLLGNGTGGFSTPVSYGVGLDPYLVKVADVNGDGIPDLLLLTQGITAHYGSFGLIPAVPAEVYVFLGNGAGGFAAPLSYQAGDFNGRTLTVADLTGDGIPDLVVTNYGDGKTLAGGGVAVLLNDGTGNFTAETYYPISYQPDAVAVLDVNRDGILDLVVGDQGGPAALLLGTGNGGFAAPTYLSALSSVIFETATDVNGDGQPDLVTLNQVTNEPVEVSLDGIACYCPGTLILAEGCEVPVERLMIGDRVMTIGGGLRVIRWIGRRSYSPRFVRRNRDILPIRFAAGCLGEGLPRRDLLVSPKHAMFLEGVLVPAECLVNGVTVLIEQMMEQVEYFHLELGTHDVVFAEGAPSETFIDDNSRGMFQNAHEHAALFPNHKRMPAIYCADRVEDGEALERIKRAIDRRAGLPVPGEGEPLRGQVDGWRGSMLRGWAQNPAKPEVPVCLEVLVDGVARHRTLANLFRTDLRASGIGTGCHGFRVALPPGTERCTIVVRRVLDQVVLGTMSNRARSREAA